jgi:DNA (cytosine-5)-methyltransferase 1
MRGMNAYYNEIDPYAAQWLRNLIDAGHIAAGDVDERSIVDVKPDDLRGYTQCHFFAGIGGWSCALRLAGWPDDRPVWTGSCPCQPFSAAGKGQASGDERHLWPHWFELIRACRPPVIFGEQVEAAIGWGWLDLVHSDLDAEGYSVGAAVLPAAGVGAPHIRQRLWFVADSEVRGRIEGQQNTRGCEEGAGKEGQSGRTAKHSDVGELADDDSSGWLEPIDPGERGARSQQEQSEGRGSSGELADALRGRAHDTPGQGLGTQATLDGKDGSVSGERLRVGVEGTTGELADAYDDGPIRAEEIRQQAGRGAELASVMDDPNVEGLEGRQLHPGQEQGQYGHAATPGSNPWRDLIWLPCTDGKQRPTQPGIFPLAHGVPARVAKLRAAGNAIVPQVAAEFIRASMP